MLQYIKTADANMVNPVYYIVTRVKYNTFCLQILVLYCWFLKSIKILFAGHWFYLSYKLLLHIFCWWLYLLQFQQG